MTGPGGGNTSWNIFLPKLDASGVYAARTQVSTNSTNCSVAGFVPDGAGNVLRPAAPVHRRHLEHQRPGERGSAGCDHRRQFHSQPGLAARLALPPSPRRS